MNKIFPNQKEIYIEIQGKEEFLATLKSEFDNGSGWLAKNAVIEGNYEADYFFVRPNSNEHNIGRPKIRIRIEAQTVKLTIVPSWTVLLMPIILVIFIAIAVIQSGSWVFLILLPLGLIFFYLMQWIFFTMGLAKANKTMEEIINVYM